MKQVDPNEQLDEDVEDLMLNYAEEYMESLVEGACVLASHRKGATVDVKDVQTHLGKKGISIISNLLILSSHLLLLRIMKKDSQFNEDYLFSMITERSCNVWIPGFGTDELKPYKRAPVTEAHKQRMALIKKTLKKY